MNIINATWNKTKTNLSFIRLKPFDISTPDGRAKERHRRVALTALASASAKGITILTALISIPLTVEYLGDERYGLWATISSFNALIGFADLGIGNGLLNAISEANGKDDKDLAQHYVSSAWYSLWILTLLLSILFMVVYPNVSWHQIFKLSSPIAISEVGIAILVFVASFLLNMPLGVIQRIQIGYQEGFVNSIWLAVGNILGLGGVLLVIYLKAGLPWLVLALVGAPVIMMLLNGIVLFYFRRPWLRPKWQGVSRKAVSKIFRLGFMFFILQLAVSLAFTSDNLVITRMLGPAFVTQYSVPYRLFTFAPLIIGMFLSPLWPAYGEAIIRRDMIWIKNTLLKSIKITLLMIGSSSLLLVVFSTQILHMWIGPQMTPSLWLMLGFAAWSILSTTGVAISMFFNGAGAVRFQVVSALLMAFSAIGAKIFLVQKIGLPGVIWATVIAYLIFTMIPQLIYVQVLIKRTSM